MPQRRGPCRPLAPWGRFTGLVIGFAGVIALLGLDFRGSAAELLGAGAALLYRRWLADAQAVGVTALMTAMCSVVFAVMRECRIWAGW